jgi:hypothetical protein
VEPAPKSAPKLGQRVTVLHMDGKSRVEIDGELFTEYVYKGWANPILYPLHGAEGIPITRNYPMRKGVDSEQTDHPHHRSLWFTHGEINGHDFWAGEGRIVHDKLFASQGTDRVTLGSYNRYVIGDELICRDHRTIVFWVSKAGRFIDYEVTIIASESDLVFGDTKEGTMALRVTPELRLKGKVAAGHIETSEGVKDGEAWGKRSKWVDYYGPVQGEVVGVAIFDHPANHGHPCRWHARDYGLVAANPWGIHHFEGAPKRTGEMKLAKGKSITLRYRFFFHPGSTAAAGVAGQYEEFARPRVTGSEKGSGAAAEPKPGSEPGKSGR